MKTRTFSIVKSRLTAVVASIAILTVFLPASAMSASASPPAVRQVASTTVAPATPLLGGASSTVGGAVVPVSAATGVQYRIPIREVVKWFQRNAPWALQSAKSAVQNGWNAFTRWWNGLPGWVRGPVNFLISGALWDFFVALRQYFFGW